MEAPRFIRSVLAINLPNDNPSVEDVTSLFAPFGDLTQVRVLRPGKTLPPYLKDYTAVSTVEPDILYSKTYTIWQ